MAASVFCRDSHAGRSVGSAKGLVQLFLGAFDPYNVFPYRAEHAMFSRSGKAADQIQVQAELESVSDLREGLLTIFVLVLSKTS